MTTNQGKPMTDKNETTDEPVAAEAVVATEEVDKSLDPDPVAHTSVESTDPEGQKRRGWVILVIIIVSFVVGAGAVGYWGWLQLETLRVDLANVESATVSQVDTLEEEQEKQRKSLKEDVDSRIAEVDASLRDFSSTIDSLSTLVVEATQSDPDGLLIAEVDYLLQLASYRIALEHNRDGALLAISRAQSRLASSSTGAYQPILEQMAKDKAALEAVVTPNVGAIVSSLATLLGRVDELGAGAQKIAPQGESPSPEERKASGWDAFISALGENLSQFVEIEEVDGAAAPTLIPNQEYFARENVRISLQNARASAVRRDPENYRLALAEAGLWLRGHFGASSVAPYMQGEIERLGAVELAPMFPDLDASLALVRKLSQPPPVSSERASDVDLEAVEAITPPAPSASEMVEEVLEPASQTVEEGVEVIEEATQ